MATFTRHHPRVSDEEREWTIAIDVADFTPAELLVEVYSDRLTVTGERPPIGPLEIHEHLDESLRLPAGLAPEDARAFYADGTLRIQVPKRRGVHRVIAIERDQYDVKTQATVC